MHLDLFFRRMKKKYFFSSCAGNVDKTESICNTSYTYLPFRLQCLTHLNRLIFKRELKGNPNMYYTNRFDSIYSTQHRCINVKRKSVLMSQNIFLLSSVYMCVSFIQYKYMHYVMYVYLMQRQMNTGTPFKVSFCRHTFMELVFTNGFMFRKVECIRRNSTQPFCRFMCISTQSSKQILLYLQPAYIQTYTYRFKYLIYSIECPLALLFTITKSNEQCVIKCFTFVS